MTDLLKFIKLFPFKTVFIKNESTLQLFLIIKIFKKILSVFFYKFSLQLGNKFEVNRDMILDLEKVFILQESNGQTLIFFLSNKFKGWTLYKSMKKIFIVEEHNIIYEWFFLLHSNFLKLTSRKQMNFRKIKKST